MRFDTVLIGDAADHFGGDEGFDDVVLGCERAGFFAGGEDVFGEQCGELVAGEGAPIGRRKAEGGRRG